MASLPGGDCWDPQLDASSTAQNRTLMTSIVIWPLDFGGDLGGLVIRMVGMSLRGGIFWSSSSTGGKGISIS